MIPKQLQTRGQFLCWDFNLWSRLDPFEGVPADFFQFRGFYGDCPMVWFKICRFLWQWCALILMFLFLWP